ELWEWDGVNSPQMKWDISFFSTGNSIHSSYPLDFHVLGNALYFVAEHSYYHPNGYGWELHKFNPTTTSVQNIVFNGNVRVYPNPGSEIINLEIDLKSPQALSVDVYGVDGKKVLSVPAAIYSQGKSRVALHIADLAAG